MPKNRRGQSRGGQRLTRSRHYFDVGHSHIGEIQPQRQAQSGQYRLDILLRAGLGHARLELNVYFGQRHIA